MLRLCFVCFGFLFLVISFTPLVRAVTVAMEQDWYDGNGDVLVVLGGSMLVTGTGANATLGHDTYLRCVYAAWILRKQKFRYVVVTGGEGAAEAMAQYLKENGVERRTIVLENRADSTYENALYTKRLLEQRYGPQNVPAVVVLTSDYHSWRARRVFEHLGFQARTIPVPDVIKQCSFVSRRWPAFLTLVDEFAKDGFYLLHGRI